MESFINPPSCEHHLLFVGTREMGFVLKFIIVGLLEHAVHERIHMGSMCCHAITMKNEELLGATTSDK